jgi:hypothetical protein
MGLDVLTCGGAMGAAAGPDRDPTVTRGGLRRPERELCMRGPRPGQMPVWPDGTEETGGQDRTF